MIKTNVMDRGAGKTTQVIEMMNNDKDLLLIIPFLSQKRLYPENLRDRIYSAQQFLGGHLNRRILMISKVVLDEGFLYKKEELAKLYYWLGYHQINVISYGSVN